MGRTRPLYRAIGPTIWPERRSADLRPTDRRSYTPNHFCFTSSLGRKTSGAPSQTIDPLLTTYTWSASDRAMIRFCSARNTVSFPFSSQMTVPD
jgi:hypothetical protein